MPDERKPERFRRFSEMLYGGETDPAVLWPALDAATTDQPDGIHTIPVPEGWSAEQAWEAIARGDELTDPEPLWANVEIKDGRFVRLHAPEED